jgi:type I restriction-modification system DNA methylase subunit
MPDANLSSFIWTVADLLRGDYKQSDYGKVILPFTVLRRLDCVLEPTKKAVLAEHEKRKQAKINPEPFLLKKSHAHQGAGHRQHHSGQHAFGRWPARQKVRLHGLQSTVRRGVEKDREGGPEGSRTTGL